MIDWSSFVKQIWVVGKVPGTWSEALEILQNNYGNSLVIQALADALHYKLVIITVHGVNYLILLLHL